MSWTTTLRGISPLGPIFGKELRVTSRLKRTYVLRVVYLGILLMVMLWVYIVTSAMVGRGGGIAQRASAQTMLGEFFFTAYGVFLVMSMGLLAPVLTATAISSERLGKTLPVLLMTPITSWQIVSGKLFSRLLIALTLIALGLPVLALVRLLGGVELAQMALLIALAVTATLSSAAIALFFSTLLNRAYAVLLMSYGTILFLNLFVPFSIGMLVASHGGSGAEMRAFNIIWSFSPYWLVVPAVAPAGMVANVWGLPWELCIAWQLSLTAALLLSSSYLLRRQARRAGDPPTRQRPINPALARFVAQRRQIATAPPIASAISAAGTSEAKEPGADAPSAPDSAERPATAPATAASKRSSRAVRDVADNPILWREIRRPFLTRRWQRNLLALICIGLLLFTYWVFDQDGSLMRSDNETGFATVFNFCFSMLVLLIGATSIAQEKESDTWTVLLAAPLSGTTIVWGKAVGVLRRMLWPTIFIAVHFLIFVLFAGINLATALASIWLIVSFNTIWIATGVYFSLRYTRTTSAILANVMLAIAAYVMVPIVLQQIQEFFRAQSGHSPDQIPAKYLDWGTAIALSLSTAWWLTYALLVLLRRREKLGGLMVASLFVFVTSLAAADRMQRTTFAMYRYVAWYAPYYWFSAIDWSRGEFTAWVPTIGRAVDQRNYTNGFSLALVLFGLGLLQIGIASIILALTSRKFSYLVGRAPQLVQYRVPDRNCEDR